MRRSVATAVLLLAWLSANGALLDSMQVFAWARMFVGHAQTLSFGDALKQTFDPAKPCKICVRLVKVRIAKTENAQHAPLTPVMEEVLPKLVLVLHEPEPPVFGNDPGDWMAAQWLNAPRRTEPVPVPPPRV